MIQLRPQFYLIAFCLGLPGISFAQTLQSATSFGYAQTDHSSQGFEHAAGSQLGFDSSIKINNALSLGIKTLGSGNQHKSLKFYRMSTGPFIGLDIFENVNAYLSLSHFNESGLNGGGDKIFKAKGYSTQVGWIRSKKIGQSMALGCGGFWSRFWGKADRNPTTAEEAGDFVRSTAHVGNQRGLQMTLQITF